MKYTYNIIEGFHSPQECKAILEHLENNVTNRVSDFPAKGAVKTSTVSYCFYGAVGNALEKIKHIAIECNRTMFGFDLHEISNFESISLNKYNASNQGEYGWHNDGAMGEMWDAKLTALLNISQEPYEGGQFELFLNEPTEMTQFNKPGSLIIFPSFLFHRVLPVTKGERITVSQFFLGPNFR